MNRSNFLTSLLLACVLAVAGSGCRKRLGTITTIPPANQGIAETSATGPIKGTGTGANEGDGVGTKPLKEDMTSMAGNEYKNMATDREQFKSQTIYFDFDKSNIKPTENSKLDAVATYLKGEAANKVLVEGHCDERGTAEYNRALGERRALSAREYLINAGIAADRVFTESYGADRPAVEGHDETAWSKNRRAEFVLLKPKK